MKLQSRLLTLKCLYKLKCLCMFYLEMNMIKTKCVLDLNGELKTKHVGLVERLSTQKYLQNSIS